MESGDILELVKSIISMEQVTPGFLLLIIIAGLGSLVYYLIRPLISKISNLAEKTEIDKIIESEDKHLETIEEKLEKIRDDMSTLKEQAKLTHKEIKDIRRDQESIKQILNQFQGHMMYGNRSSDFGNRELK
jgi:predicted nuclease with TOPRIM domain